MGAEQIGYLVKGPRRIPKCRIPAAVRACRQRKAELLATAGPEAEEWDRCEAALVRAEACFDPADIPEDPTPAVRKFMDWWATLAARDTCSRPDPDDPTQILVYAGEMTAGDEPEGVGYRMIRGALAWGFAGPLGVR